MTNTKKKWTKRSMTPGRGKHGRGFGLEGWMVCMGVGVKLEEMHFMKRTARAIQMPKNRLLFLEQMPF